MLKLMFYIQVMLSGELINDIFFMYHQKLVLITGTGEDSEHWWWKWWKISFADRYRWASQRVRWHCWQVSSWSYLWLSNTATLQGAWLYAAAVVRLWVRFPTTHHCRQWSLLVCNIDDLFWIIQSCYLSSFSFSCWQFQQRHLISCVDSNVV